MSYAESLICLNCGTKYDLGWYFQGCKSCATDEFISNLTVDYNYEKLKEVLTHELFDQSRKLWGYKDLLPVENKNNFVSLGEGDTPLIKAERLGAKLNFPNLYIKNEATNPTMSYKDRLASVAVSKGLDLGASRTVVSSSGNHGSAASAYSARAGLDCLVFTLASAPKVMISQMKAYTRNVLAVSSSEGRWMLMKKCVEDLHMYPLSTFTTWPTGNPYGVEGYKTIAYEIFSQMGGTTPDFVIVPVGYGDGLYGVWKGFYELTQLGISESMPRMVSVETSAGAPLHEAYRSGSNRIKKVAIKHPTAAFSIMTSVCGFHALYALKHSSGLSCALDDREILSAQSDLGRLEGLAPELSSAASVAAVNQLINEGKVDRDSRVVCILTSTALKQIDANPEWLLPPIVVDPDWENVRSMIGSSRQDFTEKA